MDGVRRSKGTEKGGYEKGGYSSTNNVEEEAASGCAHRDLEVLESSGGWRTLCYLEENRFGPLAGEDREEDEAEAPPGLEWRTVEAKPKSLSGGRTWR